eukprot:934260-Amphidinium_carterae.1
MQSIVQIGFISEKRSIEQQFSTRIHLKRTLRVAEVEGSRPSEATSFTQVGEVDDLRFEFGISVCFSGRLGKTLIRSAKQRLPRSWKGL